VGAGSEAGRGSGTRPIGAGRRRATRMSRRAGEGTGGAYMVVGPDSSEREGKAGLAGGPPREWGPEARG
jgi:hypothetical protein